jgi:hypothetical protein
MDRPAASSSPVRGSPVQAPPSDPSLVDAAEVLESQGVDPASGLRSAEAAERLARVGPNRLDAAALVPTWRKLLAQFADPLIYLRVAPTGGWPAPCPVEAGLSSIPTDRDRGRPAGSPCTSLLSWACRPPARRVTCRKRPQSALVDDVVLVRRLIVQHWRLALDRVDRGWRSCHGHPAFRSCRGAHRTALRPLPASHRWRPGQEGVGLAAPAVRWAGRWAPHGAPPQGRAARAAHPRRRRAATKGTGQATDRDGGP